MTRDELYDYLKSKVTSDRRDQFLSLMEYVEKETDFMKAPASTKYHLCTEGGLFTHSLNVACTLLKLRKILATDISEESCVIVALLHDLGKSPQYVANEPTDRQKKYGYPASTPYKINEDILWMEHEDRSLYMIMSRFPLTEEEYAAIRYHNEPWNNDFSKFKKNKLMTMLQNADYWSTVYLE